MAVQVMCAQTAPACFIFDADLIELLHQSAEDLRAAVAPSFRDLADLDVASCLMANTLIDRAVTGERDATVLKGAALTALQRAFPAVAICQDLTMPPVQH